MKIGQWTSLYNLGIEFKGKTKNKSFNRTHNSKRMKRSDLQIQDVQLDDPLMAEQWHNSFLTTEMGFLDAW